MAADIQELFHKGLYREILKISVDAPSWNKATADLPFVIGALSFSGRMEEAELLANPLLKKISPQSVAVRFFLGLGFTRLSEYRRARQLFAENLQAARKKKLAKSDLFFVYQGLSFYRYYCGKFAAAKKASDIAFKAAFEADHLYGKVLSTDIRGHILIQLGDTAAGFELFDRAEKLARLIGNGSLPMAIQISTMIYRARLGFNPKESLQELEKGIATLSPDDNYSRANFLLELARQWTLRGKTIQAGAILDKASEHIYANQNRRQEATLNLRYAYLMYCSGEASRGLHAIRSAKRTLHPLVDRVLEQEALGVELRILKALNMETHAQEIHQNLLAKSNQESHFIHRRMLSRQNLMSVNIRTGADPLGDLMDLVNTSPEEAIEAILENDYLGLLYDVLKIDRQRPTLYVDLRPGWLISLDRGQVTAHEGLTPQLRKILRALQQGFCSKEDLIVKVWEFQYDPLRHDTVIYAAMNSLRKLLGEKAHWLETVENGYRWSPIFEVRLHKTETSRKPSNTQESPSEQITDAGALNYRQIQILRHLTKEEFIDVQKYKKIFKVSDITASRDLSLLTGAGLVARIGRGRATKYCLAQNAE